MKIIGICGSPRVGGNTEVMVKEVLRGAKEEGDFGRVKPAIKAMITSFKFRGIKVIGSAWRRTRETGEIKKDKKVLKKCFELGKKLSTSLQPFNEQSLKVLWQFS